MGGWVDYKGGGDFSSNFENVWEVGHNKMTLWYFSLVEDKNFIARRPSFLVPFAIIDLAWHIITVMLKKWPVITIEGVFSNHNDLRKKLETLLHRLWPTIVLSLAKYSLSLIFVRSYYVP